MKVLCVENIKYIVLPYAPKEMVIVGQIYMVKERVDWYGGDWYILEGMSSGWGWRTDCFIPLSEEPEKEEVNHDFDKILTGILKVPSMKKGNP